MHVRLGGLCFKQQEVPVAQVSNPHTASGFLSIAASFITGLNMHEWDGAPPQHPDMDVAIATPTTHVMTAILAAPTSDDVRADQTGRPIFDVMRWTSPGSCAG
jgi:hypothetical protein